MNSAFPKTLLSAVVVAAGLAVCQPAEPQEGQPLPPSTGSGSVAPSPAQVPQTAPSIPTNNAHRPTSSEQRKAAQLYLAGAKQYEKRQFEEALRNYQEAVALDPGNQNYRLAADVAKSHAVTALLQTAAQARTRGDLEGARAALQHAFQLDPGN
ncbi:MAG TPA: hypothetical protein VFD98_06970, partial [Terracidiphilus sp.]|nr:hypothetical protein [Terracidiphilus sp.]